MKDTTIDRYLSGMTLKEIGLQDGVSYQTIANRLRKAGIERRRCGKRRAPVSAFIFAFCSGKSWSDISYTSGFKSRSAASQRAWERGFRGFEAFKVCRLNAQQREVYKCALDEDGLDHADALEVAREYRSSEAA